VFSNGNRFILTTAAGLVAGAALVYFGPPELRFWSRVEAPQTVATPAAPDPAKQPLAAAQPTKTGLEPQLPSFDVVRVEPGGETIIAGRSAPGAKVTMMRNGTVYDEALADAAGNVVLTPPPLPRGTQEIILETLEPDGTRRRSRDSVIVDVAPARSSQPLAAPGKPTALLSAPGEEQERTRRAGAIGPAQTATLRIDAVDAQQGEGLLVSGHAEPGATVGLYLNETFVASGRANEDGSVSFKISRGVQAGNYRIRMDEVELSSGRVKARVEVNFAAPPEVVVTGATATTPPEPSKAAARGAVVVPEVNTAVVARNESLWRISRRVYGHGLRYTVIYTANRDQIRNPNFIYPGQIFVLPAHGGP
jgi:nucleoid-associated protein YgaU